MRNKILIIHVVILAWIVSSGIQAQQTVKDTDGNEYKTVTLGTQVWMAENLKTTRYSDGTIIPNVTDSAAWIVLTTPAYCWYNNNAVANKDLNGALYNWFAIDRESNGGKNLCPAGWHVPTIENWKLLISFLSENGYGFEGRREDVAKSMAATSGWNPHNIAGNVGHNQETNNKSGFNAIPAGYRNFQGAFNYLGRYSYWWTSTEYSDLKAWYFFMHSYYRYVGKNNFRKQNGFSVRCVKD